MAMLVMTKAGNYTWQQSASSWAPSGRWWPAGHWPQGLNQWSLEGPNGGIMGRFNEDFYEFYGILGDFMGCWWVYPLGFYEIVFWTYIYVNMYLQYVYVFCGI